MTITDLLEQLKIETEKAFSGLLLPTAVQKTSPGGEPRTPAVFLMRLPNGNSAQKKVPYVIHQAVTGDDRQDEGERAESSTVVRSIFAVYDEDAQNGALALLEMTERLRIHLLRKIVIAERYELDLQAGVQRLYYPDDTAPYFAGEMVTTWKMPPVKREVRELWE